jgi:hypothetical protein
VDLKQLLVREPTPKQLARWEKIRAQGKWRFVLFWGVFRFGMPFFVISAIFDYPFGYPGAPPWVRLADAALSFIGCSVAGGGGWGFYMWHWCEASYLRRLSRVSEDQAYRRARRRMIMLGLAAPLLGLLFSIGLVAWIVLPYVDALGNFRFGIDARHWREGMLLRLCLSFMPLLCGLVLSFAAVSRLLKTEQRRSGNKVS